MSSTHAWRHSFRTLGFAFMIIGAILTIIGFIGLNTAISCPASGCAYDPWLGVAGNAFPSGITLVLAGIVVRWMVKIESEREDGRSP